jgi:hypothetical protein
MYLRQAPLTVLGKQTLCGIRNVNHAFPGKHVSHGSQENLEVQPQRPALHILHIKLKAIIL